MVNTWDIDMEPAWIWLNAVENQRVCSQITPVVNQISKLVLSLEDGRHFCPNTNVWKSPWAVAQTSPDYPDSDHGAVAGSLSVQIHQHCQKLNIIRLDLFGFELFWRWHKNDKHGYSFLLMTGTPHAKRTLVQRILPQKSAGCDHEYHAILYNKTIRIMNVADTINMTIYNTHTHTHCDTHTDVCVYIYMCVCVYINHINTIHS